MNFLDILILAIIFFVVVYILAQVFEKFIDMDK